jgi:hypothetical protein
MADGYETHTTSFGAAVPRCRAKSKRSGDQCRKPAMRGKAVCRTHGGASTGPKTPQGRKLCAEARTIHGREGRATRERRAEKLKELREIEKLMIDVGLIR